MGGVAPDLGGGAVAILHRVLGLHQLFGFLNHLAPKPSDALLGRESHEGPGAVCRGHGLGVPPPQLPGDVGLGKPFYPFGHQFPNLQS